MAKVIKPGNTKSFENVEHRSAGTLISKACLTSSPQVGIHEPATFV